MPEEKLIDRPVYMEKLKKWMRYPELIKIVTGVRRCGKSKLFTLFIRYLVSKGVKDSQIHMIQLDMLENRELLDPVKLYEHVMKLVDPEQMNYVFLDEIQMVPDWQKTANSLLGKRNIDLYLTGSNAYMFSSQLGTVLGGRYIEIKMQPLSFNEYVHGLYDIQEMEANIDVLRSPNLVADYRRYVTQSGFPQTVKFNGDSDLINTYLMDTVYNNTISKDIIERYNLRSPEKLNEVVKFLFDNISHETSILNIERQLGSSVSNDSINKYVQGLLDSYLIYRCDRMDLKGKKILTSSPKYYICDMGLRHAVLGGRIGDDGKMLENIVYLELIRRGYNVYVGKIGKKNQNGELKELEVDFIATKEGGLVEYYQVAWSVEEEAVLKRELGSLEQINDSYPKYLITMGTGSGVHNGIQHVNALQWLMEK